MSYLVERKSQQPHRRWQPPHMPNYLEKCDNQILCCLLNLICQLNLGLEGSCDPLTHRFIIDLQLHYIPY